MRSSYTYFRQTCYCGRTSSVRGNSVHMRYRRRKSQFKPEMMEGNAPQRRRIRLRCFFFEAAWGTYRGSQLQVRCPAQHLGWHFNLSCTFYINICKLGNCFHDFLLHVGQQRRHWYLTASTGSFRKGVLSNDVHKPRVWIPSEPTCSPSS